MPVVVAHGPLRSVRGPPWMDQEIRLKRSQGVMKSMSSVTPTLGLGLGGWRVGLLGVGGVGRSGAATAGGMKTG